MKSEELRSKVQELYNSDSIKVSDRVVDGVHYLSMFYANKGNTYHIHTSTNNGKIEEKHRVEFYKEVEELYETKGK